MLGHEPTHTMVIITARSTVPNTRIFFFLSWAQGDEPGQGPSKRPRRERPIGCSSFELERYNREHHSVCRLKPGVYPAEWVTRQREFREQYPSLFGGKRKREAVPDEITVDVTGTRGFDLIDNQCIRVDEPDVLATTAGGTEKLPEMPTLIPVVPADAPVGDGVGAGDGAGSKDGGGARMEAGEDVQGCDGWASDEDYYDDEL